jgi:hypothetical protein
MAGHLSSSSIDLLQILGISCLVIKKIHLAINFGKLGFFGDIGGDGGPTLGCSTGGTLNFYSIIINLLNFPHVDEHVTNKSSFFFYFLGFIIYICSRDFSWMCFFVNMRHASGPDCFCSMYGLLI